MFSEVTRSRDHEITRSRDHEITRSRDHEITRRVKIPCANCILIFLFPSFKEKVEADVPFSRWLMMHHHRITTPRRKGTWDSVEFLDRTGPGAGMIGEGGESILEIKNDNLYLAERGGPAKTRIPGRSGRSREVLGWGPDSSELSPASFGRRILGKNQVKYAPKMAVAAAMQRALARGDNLTKPEIQEAVAEFQSAPPSEARGDPPLSRIEAETCFVSIRSPRRSEGRC